MYHAHETEIRNVISTDIVIAMDIINAELTS